VWETGAAGAEGDMAGAGAERDMTGAGAERRLAAGGTLRAIAARFTLGARLADVGAVVGRRTTRVEPRLSTFAMVALCGMAGAGTPLKSYV